MDLLKMLRLGRISLPPEWAAAWPLSRLRQELLKILSLPGMAKAKRKAKQWKVYI